jgi:hypothetical protein
MPLKPVYKHTKHDIQNVKLFININSCGIFLFSENGLFINSNDLENK